MRCTRCDRIAMPQVLAHTPEGNLVFGWCPECLASENCAVVQDEPATLSVTQTKSIAREFRKFVRARKRSLRRPRTIVATRRLAALGIASLMASWAIILAFVGGWKLFGAGDGSGLMLLTGSGMMALVSLLVWVGVIGKMDGTSVLLKVVQVATAVIAIGTIVMSAYRGLDKEAAVLVAIAVALMGISWLAGTIERKRTRARTQKGRMATTVAEDA